MKTKLLLSAVLVFIIGTLKAQIIITGYLANPTGTDADPSPGFVYEYIQLMATEDINFATTPYSLVLASNATNNTPYASNPAQESWATAGKRTYKFDMTSGSVTKGSFFYVGGDGKKINGSNSTDISSANWIVARNYASIVSDEFVGRVNDADHALSVNGGIPNSGRAFGIAVFSTTSVAHNTVPIDVIFFKDASTGTMWTSGLTPQEGYLICNNDLYSIADSPYFMGDGKNTNTVAHTTSSQTQAYFFMLGGVYHEGTKTWVTPRNLTSSNRVLLTNTSTLADIETRAGVTTLPVELAFFNAKLNKQGTVSLSWSVLSEKNNAHFEILRSIDGKTFAKIGEKQGQGNSNTSTTYTFEDSKPLPGVSYYQLKQVDQDGASTLSNIVSVNVAVQKQDRDLNVSKQDNQITVYYTAKESDKAEFSIYNMSGQKIFSITEVLRQGKNQLVIPVNLSKSAIHLLTVKQDLALDYVKF